VLKFNGTPVLNLAQLVSLVTSCEDEHLRFDCDYDETIVVERALAERGTAATLAAHNIPAAISPNLAAALPGVVWPPPSVQQVPLQDGNEETQQQKQAAAAAAAARR
jgi:PDZ domain